MESFPQTSLILSIIRCNENQFEMIVFLCHFKQVIHFMEQPFHQQPNLPVVGDVHDPLLALDLLAAPRLERHEVVDLGQGARPPGDLAVHQLDQHHLDSD